jgi:NAD+ synthase (glutamine-hydrolysing)
LYTGRFSGINEGDVQVEADARRIGLYADGEIPNDPKELANRILQTVYMGSENR